MAHEQDLPLAEYHRAGVEITNGNPDVYKSLYSHRSDATLANPFGPPACGWSEVSSTLDRAAENYRDGEAVGFENVSTIVGEGLAYTVEIESIGRELAERRKSCLCQSGSPRCSAGKTVRGRCFIDMRIRSPRRDRPSPS